MKKFFTFFLLLSSFSPAKEFLQTGTSISHFYEARSLFTNPAALAFEKELNGQGLSTSLSWGQEQQSTSQAALAFSWGNWGLGLERDQVLLGSSLGLTPWLFLGSRVSFSSQTKWDGGLQIRPSRFFSLGLLVRELQNPESVVLGATLRPFQPLTLSLDFENSRTYQANVFYRILPGLSFQTGYDKTALWHFGIQFDFNQASLFGTARTAGAHRSFITHAHWSHNKKDSLLKSGGAISTKIDSSLSEQGNKGSWFQKEKTSFSEIIWNLKKIETDPSTPAVFIELESFPLGFGAANELSEVLWSLRKAGKTLSVSLESPELKEYLIASAAHHITLAPSGGLKLLGPQAQRYYFKGVLDQAGIKAEIIKKGKYKSAPEAFNQKGPSEPAKENIFENLKEAELAIESLILRSGRITKETWKKARELGVLSEKEAKSLGLVDEIKEARRAEQDFRKAHQVFSLNSQTAHDELALRPQIALIIASGDIVRKKIGLLSLMGSDPLTPDDLKDQVERAERDPRIKAIVIRVSSGGGEVLASHLMANQLRDLNRKKPVVVSMGDVAASGGYLLSVPSRFISARPLTVTGSIGVFSGKPNLAGLLKKLDIKKEVFSGSPYPRLYDEATGWSPAERKIMERQVEHFYETFLSYVSEQRKLDLSQVQKMAEGRVWLGASALEGKLIDSLEGLPAGIKQAQQLSGLGEFDLLPLYPSPSLFGGVGDLFWLKSELSELLGIAANNDLKI